MDRGNHSIVTDFFLLGLSSDSRVNTLLFLSFFIIYLLTLLGNLAIITTIQVVPRLHSPMYLFLGHLSFLDICYTSVTIPKMLDNLVTGRQTISYVGCFIQLYFFISLGSVESFLLAAMAYDRYVAICEPLRYVEVMSPRLCAWLTITSWMSGCLNSALHTVWTSQLPFCSSHAVDHFCDIAPLLRLACADTYANKVTILVVGVFVVLGPFFCILLSYASILLAILRIPSPRGRIKTLSTCSSHLTVVSLFYGSVILTYMRRTSHTIPSYGGMLSVVYTFLTPMLNPLIYSLRNSELKSAFKKATGAVIARNL